MTATADLTRAIWLWLLHGGPHTAAELAQALGRDTDCIVHRLASMAQKGLIVKFKPQAGGARRLRYGVTGTCGIPQGMFVAEVQAC